MRFAGCVLASAIVLYACYSAAKSSPPLAPATWPVLSLCVWLLFIVVKGWHTLSYWDTRQALWALTSAVTFLYFLHQDPSFKGWGDVYYFCGEKLEYCSCDFKWNLRGWGKAAALWSLLLTAALGFQKLALQIGMDGLLPGEEVVTKDSFISICWRLIPYWLNNWEQQWGAECSSMMFELPHFAVELLIILPCVQVLCSRLRILAPPGGNFRVLLPQGQTHVPRELLAADILRGYWVVAPEQRRCLPRLKANLRVMAFVVLLCGLGAFNALVVPSHLDEQTWLHSKMPIVIDSAKSLTAFNASENVNTTASLVMSRAWSLEIEYTQVKGCANVALLHYNLRKHAQELAKMMEPEHRAVVPVVESALAIMRLSCEKFFTLISLYTAYLLFREPPFVARNIIRINAISSLVFQKAILYSFPAICWLYGAGIIFSSFVSFVFWGHPLLAIYTFARKLFISRLGSQPRGLTLATAEQVERMNNQCAICWTDMCTSDAAAASQPFTDATAPAAAPQAATPAAEPDNEVETRVEPAVSAAARGANTSAEGSNSATAAAAGGPQHVVACTTEAAMAVAGGGASGATATAQSSALVLRHGADTQHNGGGSVPGVALSCGHAFHFACIMRWLKQCQEQSRQTVCPLCQSVVEIDYKWQWRRWRNVPDGLDDGLAVDPDVARVPLDMEVDENEAMQDGAFGLDMLDDGVDADAGDRLDDILRGNFHVQGVVEDLNVNNQQAAAAAVAADAADNNGDVQDPLLRLQHAAAVHADNNAQLPRQHATTSAVQNTAAEPPHLPSSSSQPAANGHSQHNNSSSSDGGVAAQRTATHARELAALAAERRAAMSGRSNLRRRHTARLEHGGDGAVSHDERATAVARRDRVDAARLVGNRGAASSHKSSAGPSYRLVDCKYQAPTATNNGASLHAHPLTDIDSSVSSLDGHQRYNASAPCCNADHDHAHNGCEAVVHDASGPPLHSLQCTVPNDAAAACNTSKPSSSGGLGKDGQAAGQSSTAGSVTSSYLSSRSGSAS